jgi:arylsulfatase A-like enzyme
MKYTILTILISFSCVTVSFSQENKPNKPNILFIAIDDMNDWLGILNGHPQAYTPNIDKLANSGVLFTNAHTSSPACSPSRNAILYGIEPFNSGLYPFYIREKMNPEYSKKYKSLLQLFKADGYNTYGAGKIHHGSMTNGSIKNFDHKEFTESINTKLNALPQIVVDSTDGVGTKVYGKMCGRPSISPLEHHVDYNISLFGKEILEREHDKPFFLALGLIKPHLPFIAPKKYFDMFPLDKIQMNPIKDNDLNDIPWAGRSNAILEDDFNYRQAGTWKAWTRSYLACIAYTDDNVGRIIKALNNSKYKDNTIVVLWSDNGYHFGEKRSFRKFSLWDEATRVPFIILDPRSKSNGKKCDAPVALIDMYPTLLEYAGIKRPTTYDTDGLSLRKLLKNPNANRKTPALTTWGRGNYSLRGERWRYTRYFDGTEELYDHNNDPHEWTNLASVPKYKKVIKGFKKYLPKKETPLVKKGIEFRNFIDADESSLEGFKKEYNKYLKHSFMNLE